MLLLATPAAGQISTVGNCLEHVMIGDSILDGGHREPHTLLNRFITLWQQGVAPNQIHSKYGIRPPGTNIVIPCETRFNQGASSGSWWPTIIIDTVIDSIPYPVPGEPPPPEVIIQEVFVPRPDSDIDLTAVMPVIDSLPVGATVSLCYFERRVDGQAQMATDSLGNAAPGCDSLFVRWMEQHDAEPLPETPIVPVALASAGSALLIGAVLRGQWEKRRKSRPRWERRRRKR